MDPEDQPQDLLEVTPAAPVESIEPAAPVESIEPAAPVESIEPAAPVESIESAIPEPAAPVESIESAIPEPAAPVESIEPAIPAESIEPAIPAESVEPAVSEPATPDEPAKEIKSAADIAKTFSDVDKGEQIRLHICIRLHEVLKLLEKSKSETGVPAKESLINAFRSLFGIFDLMLNFVINSSEDPSRKKKITWPKGLDRMRIIVYNYQQVISPQLGEILIKICSHTYYGLAKCISEIPPCLSINLKLPAAILDDTLVDLVKFAEQMLPFIKG